MSASPNLLILMVDQMQAQLLDPRPPDHANIDLPQLRALRERSIQFERAYCPAPICTPCRASFMLGESLNQHGVIGNGRPMPADRKTLADRLSEVGYQTSYLGKWHLDKNHSRGWQRFVDGSGHHNKVDRGHWTFAHRDQPFEGTAPYGREQHIDGEICATALEELDLLKSGPQPFAFMVSFFGPHAPYFLPKEWHEKADPQRWPLPEDQNDPLEGKPEVQREFRCRSWGQSFDESKWRRIRAAYFAYNTMLDQFIGELVNRIDTTNTAILFMTDHGEMNGHHNMIFKGPMMYEQLVRIPLLLSLPGQNAGRSESGLVNLTDMTATLLGLTGAPSACPDGRDLSFDLIRGHQVGRAHLISEFHEANWVEPVVKQRVAMIRDESAKLVVTEGQVSEFYPLDELPLEVHNRIREEKHRDHILDLKTRLAAEVDWIEPPL